MTDLDTIERALGAVSFPDFLVRTRPEIDIDSLGREAVWVSLIVRDGPLPTPAQLGDVRDAVRAALQAAGVELWAYFRVRTRTEDRSMSRGRKRRTRS
jgi:hypothetical protein